MDNADIYNTDPKSGTNPGMSQTLRLQQTQDQGLLTQHWNPVQQQPQISLPFQYLQNQNFFSGQQQQQLLQLQLQQQQRYQQRQQQRYQQQQQQQYQQQQNVQSGQHHNWPQQQGHGQQQYGYGLTQATYFSRPQSMVNLSPAYIQGVNLQNRHQQYRGPPVATVPHTNQQQQQQQQRWLSPSVNLPGTLANQPQPPRAQQEHEVVDLTGIPDDEVEEPVVDARPKTPKKPYKSKPKPQWYRTAASVGLETAMDPSKLPRKLSAEEKWDELREQKNRSSIAVKLKLQFELQQKKEKKKEQARQRAASSATKSDSSAKASGTKSTATATGKKRKRAATTADDDNNNDLPRNKRVDLSGVGEQFGNSQTTTVEDACDDDEFDEILGMEMEDACDEDEYEDILRMEMETPSTSVETSTEAPGAEDGKEITTQGAFDLLFDDPEEEDIEVSEEENSDEMEEMDDVVQEEATRGSTSGDLVEEPQGHNDVQEEEQNPVVSYYDSESEISEEE